MGARTHRDRAAVRAGCSSAGSCAAPTGRRSPTPTRSPITSFRRSRRWWRCRAPHSPSISLAASLGVPQSRRRAVIDVDYTRYSRRTCGRRPAFGQRTVSGLPEPGSSARDGGVEGRAVAECTATSDRSDVAADHPELGTMSPPSDDRPHEPGVPHADRARPPALMFGVPIADLTHGRDDRPDRASSWSTAAAIGRTHQISTVNVDFLVNALDDPAVVDDPAAGRCVHPRRHAGRVGARGSWACPSGSVSPAPTSCHC